MSLIYLLKQNNDYFTIINNIIEPLQISNLTKQDFENNGFQLTDLNNLDLNNLNDYELLMGTDNLDNDLYSTGIYNNPIILKTKNILDQNIYKINSISFNFNKHNDLDVKILTSFNNIDWLYYNIDTNDWELQDLDDITNQNTKEELEQKFNNIEYKDQFLNELYFQFIIDQTNDLSHNFELTSINIDLINDSQLKIIFSNEDNKWYGYDLENNEKVLIDITHDIEIFNYGLNISQFNDLHNLNPTFWNEFQGGTNKIKFQFYLSINDTQEKIELDTLTLQVDINGTWKLQQVYNPTNQTGDYDLELSDKMIRVNVYSNGSYKVNYNFIDETPPNDLISFNLYNSYYNGNLQIKLNWVPPTSYDYKDSVIMRKLNSYPNDIYDGQRINPILPEDSEFIIKTENDNEIIDQKNIEQENTYYYRQFPFDIRYNYNDNLTNNSKSIYVEPIPTDGLIAYYPLKNDQNDYSENGNHGIEYNISYVSNQASFNGSSSKIVAPYNYSETHTVVCWVKSNIDLSTSTSPSYRKTIFKAGTTWNPGLWMTFVNIRAHAKTKYMDVSWSGNKEWHQIGQIYNSSNQQLYVVLDGQLLQGTITSYSPTIPNEIVIGYDNEGTQYTWNGLISNFRIYNRQLTQQEIQMIYNQERMS